RKNLLTVEEFQKFPGFCRMFCICVDTERTPTVKRYARAVYARSEPRLKRYWFPGVGLRVDTQDLTEGCRRHKAHSSCALSEAGDDSRIRPVAHAKKRLGNFTVIQEPLEIVHRVDDVFLIEANDERISLLINQIFTLGPPFIVGEKPNAAG